MNHITQIQGMKIIKCHTPETATLILDLLITALQGGRTLVVKYDGPAEIHYKTRIKSIWFCRSSFLNRFHQGYLSIGNEDGKTVLKYDLYNYEWLISGIAMSVIMTLLLLVPDGAPLWRSTCVWWCFIVPSIFIMSYTVFFVIPALIWRYELKKTLVNCCAE